MVKLPVDNTVKPCYNSIQKYGKPTHTKMVKLPTNKGLQSRLYLI